MTVEYFTPSEEDIHTAKLWMNFYKMWGDYAKDNDDPHLHVTDGMTWLDFEHLFTEEQKEEQRRWLLPAPVIGEGPPKDFSQMAFVLKEPEAPKPTYSYRETRTIDGKDYSFYFQELPKDKK